jgi:oxygen-dependent protoporphyrinogen oxidase
MSNPETSARRPRVVVVGAGISGLSAAWRITRRRHDIDVLVVDGSDRIGGLLRVTDLEGIPLDEGAESMLATRPEAVLLAHDVGLGDSIVHPTAARPRVVIDGELKEFPVGLMMGVPTELKALAASGVLSPEALARIPLDYVLPRSSIGEDVSFGGYIAQRLGSDVVDRLVAPLIMGVYADDPYDVSMLSAMPALLSAARTDASILSAANKTKKTPTGPVFAGIDGGIGRLPQALEEGLTAAGVSIRTDAMVKGLRRTPTGWEVDFVDAERYPSESADAVIVAVPAPAAARLLRGYVPLAADHLGRIETVSVAVVTMLYRSADLPAGDLPGGSGYLVPPSEGRPVKAATFSSHKWAWVDREAAKRGLIAVRASLGHARDVEVLQRSDEELADLAASDLGFVARLGRAAPIASRVSRWGGALPRYPVGFRERVSTIDSAVKSVPRLAICGSAYEGVGIASCVARATTAADRICEHLTSNGQWSS